MKSKNSFWRAVYFAPFFYAFVGGILTVFIVYKGSGRAGLDSKESSDIALASCLVALACGLVAGLYVSWWKVRVDWHGEDIKVSVKLNTSPIERSTGRRAAKVIATVVPKPLTILTSYPTLSLIRPYHH